MNAARPVVAAIIVAVTQGCLIIPHPTSRRFGMENFDFLEQPSERIKAGVTTRREILLTLGDPDWSLRRDTLFVYRSTEQHATLVVATNRQLGGESPLSNLMEVKD